MKGSIAFACDDCIGSGTAPDAYTQSTSSGSFRFHWIVLGGPCWYFVIESFFWNSKMSSRKWGWEYFWRVFLVLLKILIPITLDFWQGIFLAFNCCLVIKGLCQQLWVRRNRSSSHLWFYPQCCSWPPASGKVWIKSLQTRETAQQENQLLCWGSKFDCP